MRTKFHTPYNLPIQNGELIDTPSMALPNRSKSILELLQCATISGDPLPLCSTPAYDDSEAAGIARISANAASIGDILNFNPEEVSKGDNGEETLFKGDEHNETGEGSEG